MENERNYKIMIDTINIEPLTLESFDDNDNKIDIMNYFGRQEKYTKMMKMMDILVINEEKKNIIKNLVEKGYEPNRLFEDGELVKEYYLKDGLNFTYEEVIEKEKL